MAQVKKQIEVKLKGLNPSGVEVYNKFLQKLGYGKQVKEYDLNNIKKKRFKQYNSFFANKLNNMIVCFNYESGGRKFIDIRLTLEHFHHEIFEIEVIENKTKITF